MYVLDLSQRKLQSLALLAIVFTLVLTACLPAPVSNTNGNADLADNAAEDISENMADNTAEDMPAEDMAMQPEGVLRVALQPAVQIDPALISSDTEVFIANMVYDYLVDIDPASNPVPRLASGWNVSDDGLIYTFTLVENAAFHDGSPLIAEDVVWTFDRLRDPDAEYPTANLYSNILSIQANGDYEVVFTLSEPNPFFLYDLSDNHALVTKAGTEDFTAFNGSGPFIVTSYSPEDRITLEANPNYFVEGKPGLAGVEVIFFSDDIAMADALRGGQVDLMMRMSTAIFESLKGEAGITTLDIPTNGFDLIRLRSDREPGSDPRVIEAFKLATDREAIWQLVQQGYGAVGNDSPIGPLYSSYFDPSAAPPARDVVAAAALLADAGYEDGLDLVLHVPDSGGRPDLAAVLQQQWAEAGINVEISVEPESVYYGDDGWLEVDLGITGWGSRPYPQFYLDTMLACDAIWNESHFCDDAFEALNAVAGSTLSEEERAQAYFDIQALLAERGPVIIPYYFAQFAAVRDTFQGFELKAFAGRTDVSGVTWAP
jgi:peptide/nickel transport system substrate-binding protein